ncbi:MAG TPA: GxxExxY protein [Phnomibacter sp.]|nr:GxxExxY protein [Phnomibacter sp.]
MTENDIATKVIGLAIKVHTALGPGLLESAYRECLYFELLNSGLKVEKEKNMPLLYKTVKMDVGYRIDILVEQKVVVEIKSTEGMKDVFWAQTITYLKLGGFRLGFLINFNVFRLKDGIKRLAYGLPDFD